MSAIYKPDEIKLLTAVLDRACLETGAHNRMDRAVLAMRILYAAGKGERDPERLLALTIAA
ncbi:hypothetical protein [Taklimakanibacter albus]|uniref:Uncharacterized protein n=1 Tax=Taklimakanibacter albus TaxID=2800327 RepID=A0ACC5R189_9HYPH|nr:hypothetical protein [Aestuariivirga sp. YIM B02566]MBK1866398.1 hypothetical protein [Aestuariivirga sp. YIM B02566]